MPLDRVRALADAVLLEGYVLYPYRASSTKNRYRWTFGALAPRDWSEGPAGSDPWWMQTEIVIEPHAGAQLQLDCVLRVLQMQRRTLESISDGAYRPVERLVDGERLLVPWEEGLPREIKLGPLDRARLAATAVHDFELPAAQSEEPVGDVGRVVRTTFPIRGTLRLAASDDDGLLRLRVRVENKSTSPDLGARREDALCRGFLSTHLILRVTGGAFMSAVDPPPHARAAVERCRNMHLHPALAGDAGQRDLMLAAPIILPDHAQVAPESAGDFFDATEIDELLTLRTSMLTDDEKRQARATDPRAAALIDRVEQLPRAAMERLHGAIRELDVPLPETGSSASFAPGDRVRLRPGVRRSDAQDLLFVGRTATVRRVMQDVDGAVWFAVTIDDDPAAELHEWYGRFHYYQHDELEPLERGAP